MVKVKPTASQGRITVRSNNDTTIFGIKDNLSEYYAKLSEKWANSPDLVNGIDYSSKYYANKSKASEENARVYENAVKETYNEFKGSIDIALESVDNKVQQSITDIENSSNEIKDEIVNEIKSTGFYIKDGDIYYLDENGNEQKFYSDIMFIVREY